VHVALNAGELSCASSTAAAHALQRDSGFVLHFVLKFHVRGCCAWPCHAPDYLVSKTLKFIASE
jgi:hypothetical protein